MLGLACTIRPVKLHVEQGKAVRHVTGLGNLDSLGPRLQHGVLYWCVVGVGRCRILSHDLLAPDDRARIVTRHKDDIVGNLRVNRAAGLDERPDGLLLSCLACWLWSGPADVAIPTKARKPGRSMRPPEVRWNSWGAAAQAVRGAGSRQVSDRPIRFSPVDDAVCESHNNP